MMCGKEIFRAWLIVYLMDFFVKDTIIFKRNNNVAFDIKCTESMLKDSLV
jgi:hypothetical protein